MPRLPRLTPLALLVAVLAACNATLQGERAPGLPAIGWLAPGGPDARVETEGKWVLLEFFSPT